MGLHDSSILKFPPPWRGKERWNSEHSGFLSLLRNFFLTSWIKCWYTLCLNCSLSSHSLVISNLHGLCNLLYRLLLCWTGPCDCTDCCSAGQDPVIVMSTLSVRPCTKGKVNSQKKAALPWDGSREEPGRQAQVTWFGGWIRGLDLVGGARLPR